MSAPHALHPTDQTLSSYGLGKLDDAAAEAVNQHLESCPTCRRRVAELSSDSFLGRLREAQARPDAPAPIVSSTDGLSMLATGPSAPAPPPASTLPPGLAGHPDYEILRELGRGGMGVVYLAQNKLMSRPEVLKVVGSHLITRPEVLERFLREIRSAARLHHTNIVTAYAALRFGESLVLAMEYVEGLDLARIVKAKGPLPVANACNYVHQAALGLQHAHEHGMVHRDIKPSNLMLARAGKKAIVKVLDFGLAKVTCEGQAEGGLTREGQMLGTPDYIAPEQIRDAQSADIRADIYSLGCTLYYLLAGRPPFGGDNLWDLYQAHFSMDAGPLNLVRPEVPVELAALVGKMMAKEPQRRFQEPKEVAQALTPFFKKGDLAFKSPEAEVSYAGRSGSGRPVLGVVSTPSEPVTNDAGPIAQQTRAAEPSAPETERKSLIDLREAERSRDEAPALAPTWRPPWSWPSVAVGVLLVALFVAWVVVVRVKTSNGVIELVNLPKDAEVFIDGEEAAVTWPGGGKRPFISITAGKYKVSVKTDGLELSGDEVTVQAGGKEEFTVRFVPPADSHAGKGEADDHPARSEVDKPPVVKSADRPKPGPIVLDNPPNPITNSIGMKLVLIPAGEFLIGSPDEDTQAPANEKPQHPVRITRPFYLGVTEVTRGQFRRFVDATRYKTEAERDGKGGFGWNGETKKYEPNPKFTWLNPGGFEQTDEHPVVQVSWNDAVAFAEWLSSKEGKTYRLPTEAEWEYACRAGSPPLRLLSDDVSARGEYVEHIDGSSGATHPADQMKPNAWGLHGMLGNVREWCADRYDERYYASSPAADPPGATQGSSRVRRGGSWWENGPLCCRPAYRIGIWMWGRDPTVGFRVARTQGADKVPAALPGAARSIGGTHPVPPAGSAVERSASAPGVKRETAPAAPLEPAEKTPLPPTRLVHVDEFGGPRHVLPRDPDISHGLSHASPGRSDGVYFAYSPRGWHAWPVHDIRSEGTCEVVARVLSDNPTKTAAWQVDVLNKAETRGFLIKINVKGELFLEPSPWKSAEAFRQIDPRMGPIRHPAIKPGNEFNKLLLILRKREVVIFVNGVQACDPVRFEYDITPSGLCFGAAGPGPKRAEFDRLEIREMTRPEDRLAKVEVTPSVTQAAVKAADRPKPGPTRLDNPMKPITNSIGMKLVLIPAGEFLMGSPEDDEDAEANEKPRHRVQITRPFYLGVTEVTQGQYRAVMGKNPSHFKRSDDLPVEGVSWFDAVKSCNKLSEREGRKPYYRIEGDAVTIASGDGYRLPTEAEWEYACRAGTATRFSFGDDENALGQYAWYVDNSNGRGTHLVGRKQPNAFGLYDMHGNVYEWCWDGYDANHYKQSPAVDPHGPGVVAHRVIRGGSLEDGPQGARSALRHPSTPENRDSNLGFRLARDPSGR